MSDDPVERARAAALRLLARREHSRRELDGKLAGRGHAGDARTAALEALAADGHLSDRRYAEQMVRARASRRHGPVRIRHELETRGVDGDVALEALEGAGEDWAALAALAHRRRFGDAPPANAPERARRIRFLRQRGFTHDQVRAALDAGDDD